MAMAGGEKIARMLVVSNDNYEILEPYFPTALDKDWFVGYWEDIDEVYSSTQKENYVDAYYLK